MTTQLPLRVGNYMFIPDLLIAEWGEVAWERIRASMEETCIVERHTGMCGYIYYERTRDERDKTVEQNS